MSNMNTELKEIGNLQVATFVKLGAFLQKHGNAGNSQAFSILGISRSDVTRATRLHQFADAVKDCNSVVSALQVCNSESDLLRDSVQKPSKVIGLTEEEHEAKRLKDIEENSEHNSYRAMTAL